VLVVPVVTLRTGSLHSRNNSLVFVVVGTRTILSFCGRDNIQPVSFRGIADANALGVLSSFVWKFGDVPLDAASSLSSVFVSIEGAGIVELNVPSLSTG
jgi:hypothetical protein